MVFLDEHRVQQDLVKSIRKWMHFQYVQRIQDRESQEILERLPTSMRQVLACVMNKQLFAKVALFSRISSEGSLKDEFTSELLLSMESEYFSIGSVIAAACTPANRLMVVVSGNICVRDPFDANSTLAILGPGDSIGDNCMIGDMRWGGVYGVDVDFIAIENCKLCTFREEAIQTAAKASPSYLLIRNLLKQLYRPYSPASRGLRANSSRPGGHSPSWATFHWISLARAALR
eukprot:CAMPEP_0172205436 /NCGR_PEP_ID=MMETSP1050-20130122/32612_1 /TAXON_ID=233186 /ORGANISM="Cryptomonas curvata, Strain CCAP979/52" /LENGTH=231 /DNA_ID=CAMNT_0012884309 /DNA_START=1135 /DNA_END=1827 /DNA_ORIENTATION=-